MVEIAAPITVGSYGWIAAFDLTVTAVSASVVVRLSFDGGQMSDLDEVLAFAEGLWNRKAFLAGTGWPIPITLELRVTSPDVAHQRISVGSYAETDMLHWRTDIAPVSAAHEVGHMLGALDEYEGGATLIVRHRTLMSDHFPTIMLDYYQTIADAAGNAFGLLAPIVGTRHAERIKGGLSDDAIYGAEGRDTLIGKAGNDWLAGDQGADRLKGGPGADAFVIRGHDKVVDFNPSEGDCLIYA